ncbi:MAG: molybdenum cofactor guanylyltransferase MobA [Burkholderiales bacterium]|nr:MAG: molybdenum cofactor guanylyltransferase MobA [Burkholderiales bacterium]
MIGCADITGLVLAGGRGSRMGGLDKGLQPFRGEPLVRHSVRRLQGQSGGLIGGLMINANRNLSTYEGLGLPVWPDPLPGQVGPLAGFLAGLQHCPTSYLLTVPCDSPLLPVDLALRLASAFEDPRTEIAVAAAPGTDGVLRPQPVFCLMAVHLLHSLAAFTRDGGRKVGQWTGQHRAVLVPFDREGDDPQAFFNANTLEELQSLEHTGTPHPSVPT